MVGTMYVSPSPDAPSFVKEGQKVNIGDTLCIIEAMKMFNEIEADKAGIIRECLVENGQPVADCNLYDCTVGNSQISSLPIDNTCTYEGEDYNCLKDIILPWMQGQTEAGEADFSVHVGDIIKGNGDGGNRRCQDSSFTSRKNLISDVSNFLVTPGGMLNMYVICLCVVVLNILT